LKIYSECALKGEVGEIRGNTHKIQNFLTMVCFDIGKYKKARFYFRKQNCTGSYYPLTKGSGGFAKNLPNLVNSIKSFVVDKEVPPTGCVRLYDDHGLSGSKVQVCADVPDLGDA